MLRVNFKYLFAIFLTLFFSTLQIAQSVKNEKDSLTDLFFSLSNEESNKMIDLGNQLLKEIEQEETKCKVAAKLAAVYFYKNDLKKSTEFLFQSKNFAEKTNDNELIAKTYGSLANQFMQLRLEDKAKEYLQKVIEITKKIPDGDNKFVLNGLTHLEYGNLEYDNANYNLANSHYKNALIQFSKVESDEEKKLIKYHQRRSLYNVGNTFLYLNKFDSAAIYLNLATAENSEDNEDLEYYIENAQSKVYFAKGEYHKAINTLQNILNDSAFTVNRMKPEIYESLSKYYYKINNQDKFIYYNNQFIKSKDSI